MRKRPVDWHACTFPATLSLAAALLASVASAQTAPAQPYAPGPPAAQPQPYPSGPPPGAQPAPPPPAGYPPQPQPQPGYAPQPYPQQPPPQQYPPPQPPPQQYPPQPPPQQYPPPQPPPQQYPPPQPPTQQGYPPPAAAPPYAQPAPAQQPPPNGYDNQQAISYQAPPPPAPKRMVPDFSVRVDPLNAIFGSRLGFELEVEVLEWLTVEAIPVFVISNDPLVFATQNEQLRFDSGGLGPLAGTSLDAGFWLGGDSFNGTVLRAGMNFYRFEYSTVAETNASRVVDRATDPETRLFLQIGSGRTWGWFTISGGIGLEYQLADKRRCYIGGVAGFASARGGNDCDSDQFELALTEDVDPSTTDIRSWQYPFSLTGRLSLGVVIED